MADLQETVERMISEKYTELMKINIRIGSAIGNKLAMDHTTKKNHTIIKIKEQAKSAPEDVLIGGLAYELSTILSNLERRKTHGILEWIAYTISPKYRKLRRKDRDIEGVIRGYGKNMISFIEYCEENNVSYRPIGFSPVELKCILSND